VHRGTLPAPGDRPAPADRPLGGRVPPRDGCQQGPSDPFRSPSPPTDADVVRSG
jgi:hypothetical protein